MYVIFTTLQVVKSKVKHEVGVGTWLIAAAIAFVTGNFLLK